MYKNGYNTDERFEEELIKLVCYKIDEYITTVKPKRTVFIAFDGVAPVAKLEQQRNRRYKSYLTAKIMATCEEQNQSRAAAIWDKTAITPGTAFMKKLGEEVRYHFEGKEKQYGIENFIVSSSDEVGEGEHKIFQYIRTEKTKHSAQVSIVYGLDADLIMLALNHLPVSKQIYLYRETPEFIKSLNRDLEPNEAYFFNIPKLAQIIRGDMNNYKCVSRKQESNRLYDYIFLCFFLGNDFMPHFPSVNIRNKGIHIMLAAYKSILGGTSQNLTDGKKIYWVNVKKLVEYLAEIEHTNIIDEYNTRSRLERRTYPSKTLQEKMDKLDKIPTKQRGVEKFIDPYNKWWQTRYYKALFDVDINKHWKRQICTNYLEGLEWTMNYYTSGCKDWRWSYKYKYPPLWKDLLAYIPSWDTTMIEKNDRIAVQPLVQLAYVLPRPSLKLLPRSIEDSLLEKYSDKYPLDCKIYWSFCKYLWEGHVDLPHIDIEVLEELVQI